jgi:purine-binding chemotaxis protein CheW
MAIEHATSVLERVETEAGPGKYLTFKLGAEEYGLDILKVREIIGLMPITAVPRTPGFIRGVINLRGRIVPVVDLRVKFGMPRVEDTELTCIIVVDVAQGGGTVNTGILVDTVSEVLDIAASEIEAAPEFGAAVRTDFILGMAKHKDSVKMLLGIDEVLSEAGIVDIARTVAGDGADRVDSE